MKTTQTSNKRRSLMPNWSRFVKKVAALCEKTTVDGMDAGQRRRSYREVRDDQKPQPHLPLLYVSRLSVSKAGLLSLKNRCILIT